MSMKSSNEIQNIKNKFKSLLEEKNEQEGIQLDALILMSGYLAEIERIQKHKNIKRNALAELIKITPSYLTQVFTGKKPLNFETIAKIQRALGIKFSVQAYYKNELINHAFNNQNDYHIAYSNLEGQLAQGTHKTILKKEAQSGELVNFNAEKMVLMQS
jgi:transcriptional regulator with XRE-family HTH domain